MRLHQLIARFDHAPLAAPLPDVVVTGIQEDSRQVAPGNLFVARGGTKTDGARYLADAAARGAVAVVTETQLTDSPIPQIVTPSAARAMSILANAFYGDPSQHGLQVLAVTGTNGKTTTTYLIRHLLNKIGKRCGMIGTVEIDDGRSAVEASMTTPAAGEVARLLGAMRDNGCAACAIETSSHALHQHRVDGVRFAAAGFTNLTGDHLDYHQTMEAYADAKAVLFRSLDEQAVAVVNGDDEWSNHMVKHCRGRVIRFGFSKGCDYRATDVRITAAGTDFVLTTPDGTATVSMQLIGRHNIENAMTAAALVGESMGLSVHQLASGLSDAAGAPGRLQVVRCGQPFAVLVDYAHTDDALENVLTALRPLTKGRLRVLFGCGGDRDRTKRPRMARTAERLADVVYVTSDNPRTEQPQSILDEILTGIADRSKAVVEIDRRAAIARIIADARPGDVVLLAGKGHENYQILGTTKHHFDDVEEATAALRATAAA